MVAGRATKQQRYRPGVHEGRSDSRDCVGPVCRLRGCRPMRSLLCRPASANRAVLPLCVPVSARRGLEITTLMGA
jgi:hypothetical protein